MLVLSEKIESYWIKSKSRYSISSLEKFISYFLPFIDRDNEIYIYDIQETEIPKNKVSIMLCVENCPERNYYKHYNKYGDYGDENINVYLYNHIDKCIFNEKYISIPIIYLQMEYLKNNFQYIKPSKSIPFVEKKFCLIATDINSIIKYNIVNMLLNTIEKCDHISDYKNILEDKSCYNSGELIDIFSRYKFVFVCENSINDGYITEKIFNCYFSRVIPIYFGTENVRKFFRDKTFININGSDYDKTRNLIIDLSKDEKKYTEIINEKIINDYDDENYKERASKFIQDQLKT